GRLRRVESAQDALDGGDGHPGRVLGYEVIPGYDGMNDNATRSLLFRLVLGANADWGTDQNAVAPGTDAVWSGVAGYARLVVTSAFALVVRGESFDDRDGARTGIAQTLSEFTATPELRLTERLVVRADARLDRSNHHVFEKGV